MPIAWWLPLVLFGPAPRDTLASLQRIIERHPNDIAAHEQFVRITESRIIVLTKERFDSTFALAVARLAPQYDAWIQRFPRSAGVQYGYGLVFSEQEDPRARPHLLAAVRLDPRLAKAYNLLARDAERWGDDSLAREWQGKAAAADSLNADYAFWYADAFEDVDKVRWRALLEAYAARFPATERAAQVAYLEGFAEGDSARIARFERLRMEYPPDRFRRSASAMWLLFEAYLRQRSAKSVELAEDMLRRRPEAGEQKEWGRRLAYAHDLTLAWSLMADRKYAAASGVLEQTQPADKYTQTGEMLALWRATAADSAGDTRRAYDELIARAARTPTDHIRAAIERYGAALGRTPAEADSAIRVIRDSGAVQAAAFRLADYASADSVSLADYRGRPVLLTFWFPGCGPCRAEFPRLQAVADTFRQRGLAYIGINVAPIQDAYVVPFLRAHHFTFPALRGSDEMAAAAYQVKGEPTNFLIDQNGRIVSRDFMARDADGQRTLELMVASLLER